ncbi:MAG: anaerobic ribonucleoside-triphosphate reductase activating protein [Planctomycetes bacterium]|nr:anaerobic ribonucleoside-triphosphate reductase activating protein [Planctomycetota bacterium]
MIDFDLRSIIENSLLEWEDCVAAVAVAGGCNFRCPFCHSWRYVVGLAGLERMDPEWLFQILARQQGWIDGVVFTGGEPTLQPGLADMMRRTREYEVKIKLHTNGSHPRVVAALLREGLLDCLALDYKAPFDRRFFVTAGTPGNPELLAAVKETFELAASAGVEREYHTTLAPDFVSAEAFKQMTEELEPGGKWFLQQFSNGDCLDANIIGAKRYDDDELESFATTARVVNRQVILKGTSKNGISSG